jgi:hypothetical protein
MTTLLVGLALAELAAVAATLIRLHDIFDASDDDDSGLA